MSFNVYTSGMLERLAENLASRVRRPLRSPFEKEVLVVMSVGMGRWLSQRMAEHLGVWANYEYVFPTDMIERIFESLTREAVRAEPFSREALSWRIMGLLPGCARLPGYEPLNSYLGDGSNELKRRQLAERIAGVFDQYVVHRPEMVLGWEEGPSPEEAGDERWQADLWRRLFAGRRPAHHAALATRLLAEIDSLPPERLEKLPSRISLFGMATLPPLYVRVLYALSRQIEIDFFVLNPSRYFWGDIASAREQARIARRLKSGIPVADRHLYAGNGLLASMGRVGRDFLFRVLLDADETVDFIDDFPDSGARNATTLLGFIQDDIRELVDRGSADDTSAAAKREISADDESISIHSCHGPVREVEVLYDYLLDVFEKCPDIEPHDVVIMTPDIETYGPFFEAVFGAPRSERLRIPYAVADRSLRSENGAAGAFFAILDLYGSRFTAGQVLDILECDSILARHGLAPSDRGAIRRWVEDTRIRWGIDAADRLDRAEKLPPIQENTWRHGLDRMLLGSAMPADEARLFGEILPYDPIEGSDTVVLGGMVELLERLFDAARSLALPRPPGEWAGHLLALVDRFFEDDEDTVDDLASLRRVITRLADETALAGFDDAVGFPVVRSWLEGSLREERAHGAFLSGGVTVCAMLPMRSIPFRVLCMVGMSDGAYPRRDIEAGFNLMKKAYRPGDRSRRNDDRYIFLEALVSARDRLFISYVGRSITDNKPIPPSVLVSELLDYIEQGYASAAGGADEARSLRSAIITEHRLQSFSPAYFSGNRKLYSYAPELCSAAESFNGEMSEYLPFMAGAMAEDEGSVIRLPDVLDYFHNPARHLLNRTLGIWLDTPGEMPGDSEAFALAGLDSYALTARMVDEALCGADPAGLYEAFRAAGMLPHGSLGEYAFRGLLPGVRSFARAVAGLRGGDALPPLDMEMEVDGLTLTGRIDRVYPGGIVHHRYASIKATDRLRAWIVYCATVCAFDPMSRPAGYLVGRNGDAPAVFIMRDGGGCRAHLGELVRIFRRGHRSIVPFFPEASLAFAKEYAESRSVDGALIRARAAFEGSDYVRGDSGDAYTERCFRKMDPFEKRFYRDEFIRIARAVYDPLLKFQEER